QLSKLAKLWINGNPIGQEFITPLSDGALLVRFTDPGTLRWNFTALTGDDNIVARTASPISVDNPMKLMIKTASLKSVEYDAASKPKSAVVVLTGNNFTPELEVVQQSGLKIEQTFVSGEQYSCVLQLGGKTDDVVIVMKDASHRVASPAIAIPVQPKPP